MLCQCSLFCSVLLFGFGVNLTTPRKKIENQTAPKVEEPRTNENFENWIKIFGRYVIRIVIVSINRLYLLCCVCLCACANCNGQFWTNSLLQGFLWFHFSSARRRFFDDFGYSKISVKTSEDISFVRIMSCQCVCILVCSIWDICLSNNRKPPSKSPRSQQC